MLVDDLNISVGRNKKGAKHIVIAGSRYADDILLYKDGSGLLRCAYKFTNVREAKEIWSKEFPTNLPDNFLRMNADVMRKMMENFIYSIPAATMATNCILDFLGFDHENRKTLRTKA